MHSDGEVCEENLFLNKPTVISSRHMDKQIFALKGLSIECVGKLLISCDFIQKFLIQEQSCLESIECLNKEAEVNLKEIFVQIGNMKDI
jgi:hypothetical protein